MLNTTQGHDVQRILVRGWGKTQDIDKCVARDCIQPIVVGIFF